MEEAEMTLRPPMRREKMRLVELKEGLEMPPGVGEGTGSICFQGCQPQ